MLHVETAHHQVAIAGRVTDAVTGKSIAGAQVRITEAPVAFVARLVMRARNVRFDSPVLDVARPVLEDPAATPADVLKAAKAILEKRAATPEDALKLAQVVDSAAGMPDDAKAAAKAIEDAISAARLPMPADVRKVAQTLLDNPKSTTADVLNTARAILATPAVVLNAARAIMDSPKATAQDRLPAAQAMFDILQARQMAVLKRPDQTMTATDGSFFFIDLAEGPYKLSVSLPGAGSRYAFDGYLFSLDGDAALVSGLDLGQKTQKLEEAFKTRRRDLPPNSKVLVITSGGEWTISMDVSGTAIELYRIYKDIVDPTLLNAHVEKTVVSRDKVAAADMSLRPTGLEGRVLEERLFSVDPASGSDVNDLDNQTLPQSIEDKLKGYFTWDPTNPTSRPTVEVQTPGAEWLVKIKGQECLALKQGTALEVYEDEIDHPIIAEVRVVGSAEFAFSSVGDRNKGDYRLVGLEKGGRKVRVSASGYETYETLSKDPVILERGVMATRDFRLRRLSRA